MPVIPVAQEEEKIGSRSKAGLGKTARPYLRNKLKAKGQGRYSSVRALEQGPEFNLQYY
jgi:hypothetical protein